MPSMSVAVIGAGNVGGTLARKWAAAGHRVLIGVRDPAGPRASLLVEDLGRAAIALPIREAVEAAGAVVFAVPGAAMTATLEDLRGPGLRGKIVIDATNRLGGDGPAHSLGAIARVAPTAAAYRAFNCFGWEVLAQPSFDGTAADMFFAGPDGPSRVTVERLIADVGFRPVWLGGPEHAGLVDAVMSIWFGFVFDQGKGRHLAFKVLGL
jgi:predicted dinucleotide-binding enzyme